MTPAQQLSKVREVSEEYANSAMTPEQFVERVFNVLESAPEGEAAGAGEAVAWGYTTPNGWAAYSKATVDKWNEDPEDTRHVSDLTVPLYTAPPAPKASAQALTDAEIVELWEGIGCREPEESVSWHFVRFAREIERAHGIPAPARMNDDKQEGAA